MSDEGYETPNDAIKWAKADIRNYFAESRMTKDRLAIRCRGQNKKKNAINNKIHCTSSSGRWSRGSGKKSSYLEALEQRERNREEAALFENQDQHTRYRGYFIHIVQKKADDYRFLAVPLDPDKFGIKKEIVFDGEFSNAENAFLAARKAVDFELDGVIDKRRYAK